MFTNPEFWIFVSFVIAMAILLKLGGKSIIGALDAHGIRIAAQIEEAAKLRAEAEALLAEQQRRQRDAIADAKSIITHAQAEAERLTGEAVAQLEHAIRLREMHARERISLSESQAIEEVRNTVADIAIEAARRALTTNLDPQRGAGLVDQSIQDIGRQFG